MSAIKNILEVYSHPYDERLPAACMDEKTNQLHAETKYQRIRTDWAAFVTWLHDERYPDAEVVVLVCDNLNTHNIASLYEAFEPAEALWAMRLEIHYTPKHGRWLDNEIELYALGNQCPSKRCVDFVEKLNEELTSWNTERNASQKSVN